MIRFKGNFINGRFVLPKGKTRTLVSEDPGDLDRPVGTIAFAPEAARPAVEAAREAFLSWSALPVKRRAAFMRRFGRALKKRLGELAFLVTRETGKPLAESRVEADRILAKIDAAVTHESALVRPSSHDAGPGLKGITRFRPRGVIAVLSPFNVPAHLASSQTISALLAGNTVVLKPSELVPFTGQVLAELWDEAGLPGGVFNLLQGDGRSGQALVTDAGVDGVFFTGSWETGRRIQDMLADEPQKILALEMGGKNAAIVLADANFENAVNDTFTGAYMTTGQRCNATSRILVEKKIAGKFLDAFLKKVDAVRIGYGADPGVFMGPMASKKGHDRALESAAKARGEGFEVIRAAGPFPNPFDPAQGKSKRGYYLKPSVHRRIGGPAGPVREGTYADEEALGPDTAIYVVKNLEEAIALNNRPPYGLVASVFTRSRTKFEKVLREAQDGVVNWNVATVRSSSRLPFGGLKRSGNNRPAGFFSPYICTIPTASLERQSLRGRTK